MIDFHEKYLEKVKYFPFNSLVSIIKSYYQFCLMKHSDDIFAPLRNYLERQCVYLSYLQPDRKLNNQKKLISSVLHVSHIAIVVRLMILLIVKPGHPILYYIADQSVNAGIAREYLYLVVLIWTSSSNLTGLYLRLSEFSPSRQKWTGLSELFRTHRFHGESGFEIQTKIGIFLGHLFFYSAAIISFLYEIPFFFWAPKKYWFFGAVMAIHLSVCGALVASWNMVPLFCLHMYAFGCLYEIKCRKLPSIMKEELPKSLMRWIATLIELKSVYSFYEPSNRNAFVSTFIGQVLIVYFVFFSNTSTTFRAVFSIYFILNLIAGQSTHFFIANYTQKKVSFIL